MVKLDQISDVEHLLTDDDKQHMVLSMEAAAVGDAQLALEYELSVSVLPGGPAAALLQEIVGLGEDAPGWVWSRWITHQAYRWLLVCQDTSVDQVVRDVIAALYGDVMPEIDGPDDLRDLDTRVAASDWAAEQLAVHELGGLRRFLDAKAGPALRARADSIEQWVTAQMSGYRLDRTRGPLLEVTDLADGRTFDVLNIGALSERHDGDTVVGRIVPITDSPHLMFASRPLSVDARTAERVADAACSPDGTPWLHVLGDACDDGRLEPGFSIGRGTLLSSDLLLHWAPYRIGVERELDAPRFRELVAVGLSPTAANGVMVCEFGLMLREVSPRGLDRFGAHLSAVLIDPAVVEGVRRTLCKPGNRDFWADMAERVAEPISARCRQLAAECR